MNSFLETNGFVVNDLDQIKQIVLSGSKPEIGYNINFTKYNKEVVPDDDIQVVLSKHKIPESNDKDSSFEFVLGDNKSSISIYEIAPNKAILGTSFSAFLENYSDELGIEYALENAIKKKEDVKYMNFLEIGSFRVSSSRPHDVSTILKLNLESIAIFHSKEYKKVVIYIRLLNRHVHISEYDYLKEVEDGSWRADILYRDALEYAERQLEQFIVHCLK